MDAPAPEIRARIERRCQQIVDSSWFTPLVVAIIALNAIIIGLETYPDVDGQYMHGLVVANGICLGFFIVEIVIRFGAYLTHPADFFKSGWHIFDVIVVFAVFIPGVSRHVQLLRLVRLLRVVRIISVLPDLRVIISGLWRSILPIASLFMLIIFVLYVYGMLGWMIFGSVLPDQWGDIGTAMITLFQVLTLEGWNNVAGDAVSATGPWAWLFFISFVLLAVFIFFNMLIGIMVNSLEEARSRHRKDREAQMRAGLTGSEADTERKIEALRKALDDLEDDIQRRRS